MILVQILLGLLGMAIGSFLNVVIDRVPMGGSVLKPRSQCPGCRRELSGWELVPVFSYMALRGRCRTCRQRIPIRVLLVEAGTGALFVVLWNLTGSIGAWILSSGFGASLIVLSVIDVHHRRIPNVVLYPAFALGLAAALLVQHEPWYRHLAGAAVAFVTLLTIAAALRGSMGMGDVKLAAFIGLIVGFPDVFVALFSAFILGGLVAGILLAAGRVSRKDPLPFGPFLSLGGMTALLAGDVLIRWWLTRV